MSKDCPVFISNENQYNSSPTFLAFIIAELHTIHKFTHLRQQLPVGEYNKLLAVTDPTIARTLDNFQIVQCDAIAEAKQNWLRDTCDNLQVMEMKGYYSDIAHAQTPSDFNLVYSWIRNLDNKVLTSVISLISSYNLAVATKKTHQMSCSICNPELVSTKVGHVFEQA